jgi:hypothetical protein
MTTPERAVTVAFFLILLNFESVLGFIEKLSYIKFQVSQNDVQMA